MKVNREKLSRTDLPPISFDASPWGGGGILWQGGVAIKCTHFIWNAFSPKVLEAVQGSSEYQTSFEYLTLFMVAVAFDLELSAIGALIRGDNLGALKDALSLNSTAAGMNSIARELGWRRIVRRWQYSLKHLPAEANDEADALSRLKAVPPRSFPVEALGEAAFVDPPAQDAQLWRVRLAP